MLGLFTVVNFKLNIAKANYGSGHQAVDRGR